MCVVFGVVDKRTRAGVGVECVDNWIGDIGNRRIEDWIGVTKPMAIR